MAELYLFGQYGLSRTGRDSVSGTVATPVLDSSIKGLTLYGAEIQITEGATPNVLTGDFTQRNGIPFAFWIFKDKILTSGIVDTTQVMASESQGRYNPFVRVNSGPFDGGSVLTTTQTGPWQEQFAMPERILHREYHIADFFSVGALTAPTALAAFPSSFRRRVVRIPRVRLEDGEGLFIGWAYGGGTGLGGSSTRAIEVDMIHRYRVNR